MSKSQGHGGDPHALVLHVFKDLNCYIFSDNILLITKYLILKNSCVI